MGTGRDKSVKLLQSQPQRLRHQHIDLHQRHSPFKVCAGHSYAAILGLGFARIHGVNEGFQADSIHYLENFHSILCSHKSE